MRRFHLSLFILFLYIFNSTVLLAAWKPSPVAIKTKDGTMLKAIWQKPDESHPVVICLHGLASNKEEWRPMAEAMTQQGWGVLAYDARGHGGSSQSKNNQGQPDGFQYFGKPGPGTEWGKMINDLGATVAYLRVDQKLEDRPLFLMGASLGANVALNYVSLTRSVKGAVLLSPGMNYMEFLTEEPIRHIQGIPILMVAAEDDQYARSSCNRLSAIRPDLAYWSDIKSGHGVQMLDPALIKRILDWLNQQR